MAYPSPSLPVCYNLACLMSILVTSSIREYLSNLVGSASCNENMLLHLKQVLLQNSNTLKTGSLKQQIHCSNHITSGFFKIKQLCVYFKQFISRFKQSVLGCISTLLMCQILSSDVISIVQLHARRIRSKCNIYFCFLFEE